MVGDVVVGHPVPVEVAAGKSGVRQIGDNTAESRTEGDFNLPVPRVGLGEIRFVLRSSCAAVVARRQMVPEAVPDIALLVAVLEHSPDRMAVVVIAHRHYAAPGVARQPAGGIITHRHAPLVKP
ncbi:MAG: hypothetical protein K2J27_02265, partial [Duncaniella sp.]|nr:hypothetical protein [Duncaniella sp.]